MFVTDRTVKVLLTAEVNGYLSGMDQAKRKTQEVTAASKEQQAAMLTAGTNIGLAVAAIGAAAAAASTLAVVKFAQFDKAMSGVKAATQATTAEMIDLRAAALEAGTDSQFSAAQAADAITQLGKAGLSTKDILSGGLSASLNLAASDNLDLATASGIAATAMQQFGLEGKDLGHVSDLLAAGANKALGGVEDLAAGLKFVGPVAHGMGVSIDETTAALAAFASQGILGEQAGTGLRGVLSSLTSPSAMAQKELERLGVTLYDSQGKFLGLTNMAGELSRAYAGMTDSQRDMSLGMIFGNMQVTAARVLYQQGAEGMQKWTAAVDDQGFAAKVASQQLDNLEGDLTKLGNTLNTALVRSGSAANDVLRQFVQLATDAAQSFADAPPAVQATVLAVLALTGAFGLLAGATVFLVPKIYETATALTVLSTSSIPGVAKAATVMLASVRSAGVALSATAKFLTGPWGIALTAATLGVGILDKALSGLKATTGELQNAIKTGSANNIFEVVSKGDIGWHDLREDLKDLPNVLQAASDQASNVFARFDSSHFSAINALKDLGVELGNLASTDLPTAQKGFQKLAGETDGSKKQLLQLLNAMPGYKAALIEQANALGIVVTGSDEAENNTNLLKLAFGSVEKPASDAAAAYTKAADKAKALDDQITDLIDTINAANGVGQDAVTSNAAYQQALEDAGAAVKEFVADHGKSAAALDESTAAGATNAAMLANLAADAQAAAKAQLDLDGKTGDYKKRLEDGRQAIYDTALALTGSADAAQALTDKIFAMPSEKELSIVADTSRAKHALDDFITDITTRRPVMYIEGRIVSTGTTQSHARGGTVTGIGTAKSDSNLAFLSKGEEVIQEPYASRFRPQLKAMNQGMIPAFAGGGTFAPAPRFAPAPPAPYMQAQGPSRSIEVNLVNPITRDPLAQLREEAENLLVELTGV